MAKVVSLFPTTAPEPASAVDFFTDAHKLTDMLHQTVSPDSDAMKTLGANAARGAAAKVATEYRAGKQRPPAPAPTPQDKADAAAIICWLAHVAGAPESLVREVLRRGGLHDVE